MKSTEEIYLISLVFAACGIDANTINNPIEYLEANASDLLTEKVISFIREKILNVPRESKVKTDELILFLIRNYIKVINDDNHFLVRYLKNSNVDAVLDFFKAYEGFAKDLICAYFSNLNKPACELSSSNESLLFKYTPIVKIESLGDMLRGAFSRLYNAISKMELPVSPVQTFLLAMNGQALIGGHPKAAEDVSLLKVYFPFLLQLMYADVYENLVASGLINNTDKKISVLVNDAIKQGKYKVPSTEEEANLLFNHFNYLASDRSKRVVSRRALNEEAKEIIKKMNPMWMLDGEFVNKR